jgi:hypothetical protein
VTLELALAYAFGVIFVTLLFIVACVIAFKKDSAPIAPEAMFIFRVVLSLAAAGVAGVVPGFLSIDRTVQQFTLSAGGALAVFLIVSASIPRRSSTAMCPRRKIPFDTKSVIGANRSVSLTRMTHRDPHSRS